MTKQSRKDNHWHQIQAAIARRVARAAKVFASLRAARPELAPFAAPGALTAQLHATSADCDDLYRALVGAVRDREEPYAALARDLLWLGAWPILNNIYVRSRVSRRDGARAADVSLAFSEAIVGVVLLPSEPAIETIARETASALKQIQREEKAWTDRHEVDQAAVDEGMRDMTAPPPPDPEAVRAELNEAIGRDGDLIFLYVARGESMPEIAAHTGVSEPTVRRRIHRASKRMRASRR
jgi:hypothetical protein